MGTQGPRTPTELKNNQAGGHWNTGTKQTGIKEYMDCFTLPVEPFKYSCV